jgi:hypothetical protein
MARSLLEHTLLNMVFNKKVSGQNQEKQEVLPVGGVTWPQFGNGAE